MLGGRTHEIQETAEEFPFNYSLLDEMTNLAAKGIADLTKKQMEALGELV